MWARVVEIMLGCWLAMSPFIFQHGKDEFAFWANDFICAVAVIVLGVLSYWNRTAWAHLLTIGVGVWLIGFGYFYVSPPTLAALQNNILVGLLLLMFAVIPNQASLPPEGWREYLLERQGAD